MKISKLTGTAGLVAGLAGGALFGALLGAPNVSGAQTTSTTAVADAPATTTPADGPGIGCRGPHGAGLDAAATALGLTNEGLRTALADGSTIAEVAKSKNVGVQKVIDAMVADATDKIDAEVTDGRLTEAQADDIKADLETRITSLVNEGKPARGAFGPGMGGGHRGFGRFGPPPTTASTETTSA